MAEMLAKLRLTVTHIYLGYRFWISSLTLAPGSWDFGAANDNGYVRLYNQIIVLYTIQ